MNNDEFKKRIDELFKTKQCSSCGRVGKWAVQKVTEGVNLIPKTALTPAKRDFDHPVFVGSIVCQCGVSELVDLQTTL